MQLVKWVFLPRTPFVAHGALDVRLRVPVPLAPYAIEGRGRGAGAEHDGAGHHVGRHALARGGAPVGALEVEQEARDEDGGEPVCGRGEGWGQRKRWGAGGWRGTYGSVKMVMMLMCEPGMSTWMEGGVRFVLGGSWVIYSRREG